MILGDNIFYGQGFQTSLRNASCRARGATVFAYSVKDPERYGIVDFDERDRPLSIVEKPRQPRSNYAVTGLYFYDNQVLDIAARLAPSPRGELEITDVNRVYLERGQLAVERLGRVSPGSIPARRHRFCRPRISCRRSKNGKDSNRLSRRGCLSRGFINEFQLANLAREYKNSYGEYLLRLIEEKSTFDADKRGKAAA